ncbi:hypothetical protein ACFQ0B_58780 [Nonomuraea thailandensis]
MLRIGTWRSPESVDVIACGWHDDGPGPLGTGVKLIYGLPGPVPPFPGLQVGEPIARSAEEIAELLTRGMDVVRTAPGGCPAAPVVAAGIWHYGWTRRDRGAWRGRPWRGWRWRRSRARAWWRSGATGAARSTAT